MDRTNKLSPFWTTGKPSKPILVRLCFVEFHNFVKEYQNSLFKFISVEHFNFKIIGFVIKNWQLHFFVGLAFSFESFVIDNFFKKSSNWKDSYRWGKIQKIFSRIYTLFVALIETTDSLAQHRTFGSLLFKFSNTFGHLILNQCFSHIEVIWIYKENNNIGPTIIFTFRKV